MCSFRQPLRSCAVRCLREHHSPAPSIFSPVESTTRWIAPASARRTAGTSTSLLRRESVVWSGAFRSRPISRSHDATKPSGCRSGRWKTMRRGSAVSRPVRGAPLPATPAGRRRGPHTESRFAEPDGDVASGAQPALLRLPVPDPIPLLVLGVHAAGLRRRHGCAPSTAWCAGARTPKRIHAPTPGVFKLGHKWAVSLRDDDAAR